MTSKQRKTCVATDIGEARAFGKTGLILFCLWDGQPRPCLAVLSQFSDYPERKSFHICPRDGRLQFRSSFSVLVRRRCIMQHRGDVACCCGAEAADALMHHAITVANSSGELRIASTHCMSCSSTKTRVIAQPRRGTSGTFATRQSIRLHNTKALA